MLVFVVVVFCPVVVLFVDVDVVVDVIVAFVDVVVSVDTLDVVVVFVAVVAEEIHASGRKAHPTAQHRSTGANGR